MTGKRRILVVEDNLMLAETYVDLLGHWGYDVLEVQATGEAAIEAARRESPDLVLMDISLDGRMDGIEASGLIAADLGVPIIIISGLGDEVRRARAARIKKHRFMVKPIDFKRLENTLKELLTQ